MILKSKDIVLKIIGNIWWLRELPYWFKADFSLKIFKIKKFFPRDKLSITEVSSGFL